MPTKTRYQHPTCQQH